MRVDVYNYSNKLNDHRISNSTVVVVDVLRATTSIIWAIKNGSGKSSSCAGSRRGCGYGHKAGFT